jgi:peptide methionine sulfoxide reductase MsrA
MTAALCASTVVVIVTTTTWIPDYHQQYLYKVPHGYCPIHATGVKLADG